MWADDILSLSIYTIILATNINSVVPSEHYCLAEDTQPYLYFSTKTAYEVTQQKYEAYQEVLPSGIQEIPDCKPVAIWMLIRHGTRYPDYNEIKKFRELANIKDQVIANHLDRKNGELCGEDLTALREWSFNVTEDDADQLTKQGQEDLTLIARRMKYHFRELLDATYTEERFTIRYTDKERTKESAKCFTKELFGRSIDINGNLIDPMLSPENNCTGWDDSIHRYEATKEANAFKESSYVKQTIRQVSRRLGFQYDLTFEAVHDIYNLCRFDKAWYYKSVSPWCAAFTPSHLKIMEYYEDLSYYYSSGYGNPKSVNLGCPLVQDLIYKFDNMTQNVTSDIPAITFYFTHSVVLRTVLTRLGIAKDHISPSYDNYNPATTTKRQWRTSIISPFAGNLAVLLYQCRNSNYKLMFYLNEQFVDYAGCHAGLCDWPYIYNSFAETINSNECNLDFCFITNFAIKFTTNLGTIFLLIHITRIFTDNVKKI